MTVNDVITNIDAIEPNQYTTANKLSWLNRLDNQIWDELILTHEHEPDIGDYTPHTATSDDLLVPSPYGEEIYEYYLKAMITASNHENVKYNFTMALFNAAYTRYSAWYNRNHVPIPPFPENRLHF